MTEERVCNSLPSTPTSRQHKNDTNMLVDSPFLTQHLSKSQNNTPVKNSPAESFVCSAEAFKRSGPDGSPAFRKSTVNYSRDDIFQPVRSLDFSEILFDSVTDLNETSESFQCNMNPQEPLHFSESGNVSNMSPSSHWEKMGDDKKDDDTDQFEQLSIESDSDQDVGVISPLRPVQSGNKFTDTSVSIQDTSIEKNQHVLFTATHVDQNHDDYMFKPPRSHNSPKEHGIEIIRNDAGNIRQPADGFKSNYQDSVSIDNSQSKNSPIERMSVNVRKPDRGLKTTLSQVNKGRQLPRSVPSTSGNKSAKTFNTSNHKVNAASVKTGHKACLSVSQPSKPVGMTTSSLQKKSNVTSSNLNNARKNTSNVQPLNHMRQMGKGVNVTTADNDSMKFFESSGDPAQPHGNIAEVHEANASGKRMLNVEQSSGTETNDKYKRTSHQLLSNGWNHLNSKAQDTHVLSDGQFDSQDVQGMEHVRDHLQSMLKMSSDVMEDKKSFDYNEPNNGLLVDIPLRMDLQKTTGNSAQNIQNTSQGEVTDLFENFPNLSSQIWTDISGVDRADSSLHTENQHLREVLEKERFRRKHCEQHIQKMNGKLLETQQQLAVAVSTDKRKDIMIEQLDKQLAKVIEGWKKRDSEKDEYIKRVIKDKVDVEETLRRQQQMVSDFEKELHNTVEELRKEKENSSVMIGQLQIEVREKQDEAGHMAELLNTEKEQGQLTKQEYDRLKEFREIAEQKTQQLQDKLHKEQDKWFEREQELLKKIDDINEVHMKTIQDEKRKFSEEETSARETKDRLQQAESENKKVMMELDCVMREKESLKVEMSIMEAKFESAQRKLEADIHSEMEKEISQQVAEVHQQALKNEQVLLESHKQQIHDIAHRQAQDVERHLKQFQEELKKKDGEFRKEIQDMENRLAEYRNENTKLRHTKQKLESQKMEILTKLQYMMQSQWQEAVTLFGNTPMKSKPADHHNNSLFTIPLSSSSMSSIFTLTQPLVSSNMISSSNNNGNPNSHPLPQTSSPSKESTISNFTIGSEQLNKQNLDSRHPDLSNIDNSIDMQRYFESLAHQSSNVKTYGSNQNSSPPRKNQNPSVHSHNYKPISADYLDVVDIQDDFKVPSQGNFNQYDALEHQPLHIQNMLNTQNASTSSHNAPTAIPMRPPQQMTAQNHSQIHSKASSGFVTAEATEGKHVAFLDAPENPSDWSETESIDSQRMIINQETLLQRVGMSPPVKQSKTRNREDMAGQNSAQDSFGNISEALEETERLNANYSHLTDRLDEHESRQSELQHYIQMLLERSPGSTSQDTEQYPCTQEVELAETVDLNDTEQAAQLHRELRRLQQLRQMEEEAALKAKKAEVTAHLSQGTTQKNAQDIPGVLSTDQLAAISVLLGQVKGKVESPTAEEETEQAAIIQMLKTMQTRSDNLVQQSEKEVSSNSKVNKNDTDSKKVRRSLHSKLSQPAADGSSSSKSDNTKQVIKKNERKLAGPKPGVNKATNVWK